MTQRLAVIYANDCNIWDNHKKDFHYFNNMRVCIDEMNFAMPLEDAEEVLKKINEERENEGVHKAYIYELTTDSD